MLLIIDNFDSFTYNLVQYLGELGAEMVVYRNNAIGIDAIRKLTPAGIVISPGPGRPEDAGVTMEVIRAFAGSVPILGVCLGHQAIGATFGGAVVRAPELMHGKVSTIHHDGKSLFRGLENPFTATRYHSLILDEGSLPACLEISARSDSGLIMAVRHREMPLEGVQFHPESILTTVGKSLLQNFLKLCAGRVSQLQRAPTPAASRDKPVDQGGPHETFARTANLVSAKTKLQMPEPNKAASRNMLQQAIQKAIDHIDLERPEAFAVMSHLMSGEATPAQIAAFLVAMRMKGERVQEIAGFAEAMRQKATAVPTRHQNAIDMCGTGGDGKGTFNISTVASFVVAGAGIPVAKHGNRSVSSKCGSADVLMELGININLNAEQMGQCLDDVGLAFLFAPALHPAAKHAIGPRREIGVRTVFNILGPITNPAGVRRQVIGVYDRWLTTLLAEVLAELGTEKALLVHSEEGLDEISIQGPTHAVELSNGKIIERALAPEDFGLTRYQNGIAGGSVADNARTALRILNGETGAARDIVIANAACGLWVAGAARTIKEGASLAAQSLDSSAALKKFQELREITNSFANA